MKRLLLFSKKSKNGSEATIIGTRQEEIDATMNRIEQYRQEKEKNHGKHI